MLEVVKLGDISNIVIFVLNKTQDVLYCGYTQSATGYLPWLKIATFNDH